MVEHRRQRLSPYERGIFYDDAYFRLEEGVKLAIISKEEGNFKIPRKQECGFLLPYGSSAFVQFEFLDLKSYFQFRYLKADMNPASIRVTSAFPSRPGVGFEFDNSSTRILQPTPDGKITLHPGNILLHYSLRQRKV